MSKFASKPKLPAIPPTPAPAAVPSAMATPLQEDPTVQAASEEAKKKQRDLEKKRQGRAATIITGGSGVIKDPLGSAGSSVIRPQASNLG